MNDVYCINITFAWFYYTIIILQIPEKIFLASIIIQLWDVSEIIVNFNMLRMIVSVVVITPHTFTCTCTCILLLIHVECKTCVSLNRLVMVPY